VKTPENREVSERGKEMSTPKEALDWWKWSNRHYNECSLSIAECNFCEEIFKFKFNMERKDAEKVREGVKEERKEEGVKG